MALQLNPPFLEVLLAISIFLSASSAIPPAHEQFLQCLHHHNMTSKPSTSQVLYTPNTTSYNTLLLSSLNNLRFRYSTPAPVLIIAPEHESQIQASLICCRKHGLRLRARSGGHDYEGLSYRSDGEPFVMVDLNKLRSVHVDAEQGTAWVQAGATLGELYYSIVTKSRGAGFPAGSCPTVGIGGHFSGGGYGTLTRKYGLAADNIIDARMVDINGRIHDRISMGDDLFWAIRGGGGASFGVIISYKIKLVSVPPKVTVFSVNRTLSHGATKLVTIWQQIAPKIHDSLYISAEISPVNDEEKSKENRTILVIFRSLFLGGIKEVLSLMENSFPELGLEAEDCLEMSWIESVLPFADTANETLDALLSRKSQYYTSFKAKYDFVREPISEMGWEEIWKWLLEGDESFLVSLHPYGGRMDEISESEIPFPHRKGNLYTILYLVSWGEGGAASSDSHIDWMRRLYRLMTPHVSKHPRAAYLNGRDLDIGRNEEGRTSYSISSIWGKKYFKNNFKRLAYVKGRVDPGNFFRDAQSIPPLIVGI